MVSMTAFADELVKIAGAAQDALPLLKRIAKPAAIAGSGALAYHLGGKEIDKYRLGRRVYEQMQAQQGE
jgi:hypothetical protein